MPWHWQETALDLKLAIWKIEEAESYFLQRIDFIDPQVIKRYRHPQSRLHWMASRLLLHQALGNEKYQQLSKDNKGKPKAKDFELSISHSEDLVAIAIGKKDQSIGLDIQHFSSKLEAIASKFIPAAILDEIKNAPYFKEIVHIHWGIKEALFKAYGKGRLDFKKHLILEWNQVFDPNGESFKSYVKKENEAIEYQSAYEITEENYLLCLVTNP
jgi:4'-phosphopantetheinyl transferase